MSRHNAHIEVDVVNAQVLQRLIKSLLHLVMMPVAVGRALDGEPDEKDRDLCLPEFRCNEEFLPGNTAVADRSSHCPLVVVPIGGIKMTITCLQFTAYQYFIIHSWQDKGT